MIGNHTSSPQRFFAATFLAIAAAACSGGGGGGPSDAAPVILTASFQGAGSTPAAGDTLTLVFSEAVTAASGVIFDDDDVALSAGATLGTVTAAPTVLGSTTIRITLGAGVAFTPGTTTIGFSDGNDVVRDASGQLGAAGTPVTIGTSDGVQPVIGNITIAAIDGDLNGTGAAGGTLQVPSNGWTIDLTYSDNSAISTSQTQITCSVAVSTGAGVRQPGANLRDQLTTIAAGNTAASYRVPSGVTFPNGAFTITAVVVDVSGLASDPVTFTASARAFTDALRPFETTTNAQQVWYLDFDRDLESYSTSAGSIAVSVDVNLGANGRGDFEDLLRVLGLNNASPLPVSGSDSNTVVFDRIKAAILSELAALYDGANVAFTLTQPSGSFGGNTSVTYASLGFSQISIAGASTTPGVLGLAIFDPSNTTQNDNTDSDFQSQRLGVFVHTVVDSGMDSPSAAPFRITFDPFASSQGGTPIGDDGDDDDRLANTLNDARATDIDNAIADLARFVAVVTAHECGHSVGLVEDGAMPNGLYGGDSANFAGSSSGHIRNTNLFPVGATNVMSPSLSYSGAVNAASAFNSLNLAYLQEQVFYGN